jgi:dihydropteroate synthase
MDPVLRISGRGSLRISLNGLTSEQTALLQKMVRTTVDGVGFEPGPSRPSEYSTASTSKPAPPSFLTGSASMVRRASGIIAASGGGFGDISKKIDSLLDNYLRTDYKIDCKGTILDLGSRTHVMGILNVTPDSFSDGGRYVDTDKALAHAHEMVEAGADIIDIGGESTRPGAPPVSEEEELARVIPVIKRLAAELRTQLSIDTYKAAVAKKALEAGASIVNDISGLRFSPEMAVVAASHDAVVVIMHIKGTPRDMQQSPVYEDIVMEVMDYLDKGIRIAVQAGVNREKILVDPGIGFGKTGSHNLTLLNRLEEFRCLGRPILLGTSRKKFIGSVLNLPVPEQRADGTAATITLGIERGARIVRVHDVARMVQVARMTDAIMQESPG